MSSEGCAIMTCAGWNALRLLSAVKTTHIQTTLSTLLGST